MSKQYTYLKNEIELFAKKLNDELFNLMNDMGDEIVKDAKNNLLMNGAVDTGQLYQSIKQETKRNGDVIELVISSDAKSKEGTEYAEFIEYGTGIHNEQGTGRQTPWKYKDRDGNWRTTSGQVARPYIRPAVETNLADLQKKLKELGDKL